jgi:hypothetical protein
MMDIGTRIRILSCCALLACGGGGGGPMPDAAPPSSTGGSGSINGIVSDIGTGVRVAGATVTGGGQTTTTDVQGAFTLTGLAAGTVSVSITKDGYAPGFANARAGDHADAVLTWLKKQAPLQPYNATAATTLSQRTEAGPYAVIFQPGTLDSADTNLRVSITPLDPTKEVQALPGNLVSGGANPAPLLPVTFAEFTILDSKGARVNLKSSASAIVELPIPPALRSSYPAGAKIHCYSYDAATGAWEDFVEGTVQTSSVDGTSPVLAATVRHFSWYGGAPQGDNCVDVPVQVVSVIDGRPLGNARVEATPGTATYTDADGNATVRTTAMGVTKYTAYQTGFDVDGSLTGMPGAKYIEFGETTEQTAGTPTSCTAALRSASEQPAAAAPKIVLKIGVIKNLLYQATATLAAGSGGAGGSVSVILQAGVPDEGGKLASPMPASGAKIALAQAGGGTPISLTEIAPNSGFYAPTTDVAVVPGTAYTLQIDADGNGSIDGSATAFAVGKLAWINPTSGASIAGPGFIASWSDTGNQGNPAYAPVYEVLVTPQVGQDTAIYIGTAPQFGVKSAVTGGPLIPATYTASLIGFSGFAALAGGGFQLTNNITGAGVTGTMFSIGTAPDPVTFTIH